MSKQLKITAFIKKPTQVDYSIITIDDETTFSRKYLPDDFVEEEVKRKRSPGNKFIVDKSPNDGVGGNSGEKGNKQCPFYKKIPNTNFAVDAFNYGIIPGIKYYFLSHYHYDHYIGLRKSFTGTIVCSSITGRLVMSQIGVNAKHLIMIDLHKPTMVDNVKVVLIDAFHCPGAVMFLMILPSGKRILHTGDFRASPDMEKDVYLTERPIDQIYLDTTYCNPNYDFPSQSDTLHSILKIAKDHLHKDLKLLIVCGSYSIGKEKVFKIISQSLSMNIWVSSGKLKMLQCINDEVINRYLVKNKNQAQIHVLPMRDINHKVLKDYLESFGDRFTSLLAFKPTGWTESGQPLQQIKPSSKGNVSIYGIPYSEHSSYKELERFIKFFKPTTVIPTVNVGNLKTRAQMTSTIAAWKSSSS